MELYNLLHRKYVQGENVILSNEFATPTHFAPVVSVVHYALIMHGQHILDELPSRLMFELLSCDPEKNGIRKFLVNWINDLPTEPPSNFVDIFRHLPEEAGKDDFQLNNLLAYGLMSQIYDYSNISDEVKASVLSRCLND